ncbi:MAG: hypothetical protein HRJ53_08320 [Acidobacteria bacterium Pan2503]|uniref:DUF1906 domain-containing protein n=1 Tax=Candidatus Acidiferrum panamense TaxID=2741543 RepID=A0A7V8NP99_9BACT|nr:hypothetical protein [Candidatus Acidoferrum panamensis]
MTLHKAFDAAFPPLSAPIGCSIAIGYIGGKRATNVWTLQEWKRFALLRQIPVYVPDLTLEKPADAAVNACDAARSLGWAPDQRPNRVIVCDLETSIDRSWYAQFTYTVAHEGFQAVAYGSLSTVLENAASDVWVAAWDGSAALLAGQTIHGHQWAADVPWQGTTVDLSVCDDWMWDGAGRGPRHN